jgi:hypothetical protein
MRSAIIKNLSEALNPVGTFSSEVLKARNQIPLLLTFFFSLHSFRSLLLRQPSK